MWSPYSQRSRARTGSAEYANGHAGSVNSVMQTAAAIARAWQTAAAVEGSALRPGARQHRVAVGARVTRLRAQLQGSCAGLEAVDRALLDRGPAERGSGGIDVARQVEVVARHLH